MLLTVKYFLLFRVLICQEYNNTFATDLGNLHETSAGYS